MRSTENPINSIQRSIASKLNWLLTMNACIGHDIKVKSQHYNAPIQQMGDKYNPIGQYAPVIVRQPVMVLLRATVLFH